MIDLLVVCSEAGMGLESGLERVAEEMNETNPAMARVLNGLLDDLRILPNRSEAFEKLGATSDGLRRFGTMVSQSLQYGTPLRPGSAQHRCRPSARTYYQAGRKSPQARRQADHSDGVVPASGHVRHFGCKSVSAPHPYVLQHGK